MSTPTPESDAAMEQTLSCTDHGSGYIRTVPLELAQGLERRLILAERKLEELVKALRFIEQYGGKMMMDEECHVNCNGHWCAEQAWITINALDAIERIGDEK